MLGKYEKAIDEFIKHHLDRREFAYMVLSGDERLRNKSMTVIKDKFLGFWDAREEESDTVSNRLPSQQTPFYSLDNLNNKEEQKCRRRE